MKKLILLFSVISLCSFAQLSNPSWSLNGNKTTAVKKLGTTSNQDFSVITNNVERMRLTTAGSIGIGTSVPEAGLHLKYNVNSSTGTTGLLIENISTEAVAFTGLRLRNNTGELTGLFKNSSNNSYYGGPNSMMLYQGSTDPIAFCTNQQLKMLLDGNGNLGIGTIQSDVLSAKVTINKVGATPGASNTLLKFKYDGFGSTESDAIKIDFAGHNYISSLYNGAGYNLVLGGLSEFLDNVTALDAGMVVGSIYRTGDFLKIVH